MELVGGNEVFNYSAKDATTSVLNHDNEQLKRQKTALHFSIV